MHRSRNSDATNAFEEGGSLDIETLFSNSIYLEQERREADELSAFTRDVAEEFALQQAGISERDWLDECESMDMPPLFAVRNWRAVSIAASVRLAGDQRPLMPLLSEKDQFLPFSFLNRGDSSLSFCG